MGISALIAGFILLFNPVIHVVDIIPDAIGFFLIVAGLSKMSCFIDKAASARLGFIKLGILEVVKVFSFLLIPVTSASMKVLLAFVFGLGELLLFIPTVNDLFEGFTFAGMWYDSTAVYAKAKQSRAALRSHKEPKELLTKTKRYIVFFYIFRVAATLLPELTELELYDHLGYVTATSRGLTYYKPFLYILCSLAVTVLGIIYIVKVSRYFGGIKKDLPFVARLKEKYERDVLVRTSFFIAKNMKSALIFMLMSAITSLMFILDGVNILVGAVSSVLLVISAALLMKYEKNTKYVIILSVFRSSLSVFNLIQQIRFYDEYSEEAVFWIENAAREYYTMAACECLEYALALTAAVIMALLVLKTVKKQLPLCGVKFETVQYSKQARDDETYAEIKKRTALTIVMTALNFVAMSLYHYILPQSAAIVAVYYVVAVVYIVFVVKHIMVINELVYDRELTTA